VGRHTGAVTKVADTDLYATLGVAPTATTAEITAAFRAQAKDSHPDRHGGDPQIADHFKALTNAYAVLIRPATRAAYDRRRARSSSEDVAVAPTHPPLFKTVRNARIAFWAGVALMVFGLGGIAVLGSIDTGDAAKTITLWIVVVKLLICGAILAGLARWRIGHSNRGRPVTAQ